MKTAGLLQALPRNLAYGLQALIDQQSAHRRLTNFRFFRRTTEIMATKEEILDSTGTDGVELEANSSTR